MFELIFYGALALASIASIDRLPATSRKDRSVSGLYNNRRQVDFYILLMTCGLGMSVVALAQDLFLLFIGLELASFSTYVLVAFMKETKEGSEAGMKYFIVGSVASGVGLYGLSLLYLWAGSLQFEELTRALQRYRNGPSTAHSAWNASRRLWFQGQCCTVPLCCT